MTERKLLDMDGVLVNFHAGAIKELNRAFNRNATEEGYAREFGSWDMQIYYGITMNEFWRAIEENPTFWIDLEPLPWAKELYNRLCETGEVTIVTAPSKDPECSKQKLQWLDRHLGVSSHEVFLGHRKYLMAGNGILIDDYAKNTRSFSDNGGKAILVPATWNTPNLTFDMVWNEITSNL